jgi:dTDP-4-amino-4,6-dideoxygalactose transaminase
MSHLAIHGGNSACNIVWPRWPVWGDAERQALSGVLESGEWWYGDRVAEFEARFAAFQGARFGVTCTSGTTALEVALLALGVGAGDEVIVPPFTFVATASAVLRVNAIPIFADIQPHTLNINPDDVESKITSKTRAIIPVHVGGYIADMDRLSTIASAHKIAIVEDACHAWGSQWKEKGAGALGECGAFSFQASKNITSGEGGILLTDNEELAALCRSYTNCGRRPGQPWYKHFVLGSNLRLTEFQAAILLAQLTRLEEQTLTRQANAAILDAGLAQVPGIITLAPEPRMTRRAYHFYPFRIDSALLGLTRDAFVEALVAEGVPLHAAWPTPIYKNPLFQRMGQGADDCPRSCPYYGQETDYANVVCPVCEQVCGDTCWIPQHVLLAEDEAMRMIVAAVRKVCQYGREGPHGYVQGQRRPG